jgi:hypothetical protein
MSATSSEVNREGLTFHRQEVQANDDHKHNSHPDCNIDIIRPVVDDESRSSDLIWDQNTKCVPVKKSVRDPPSVRTSLSYQ